MNISDLKDKLNIVDVIGIDHKLKPDGHDRFIGIDHDSLTVWSTKQTWKWYSHNEANGDVLSWLSYKMFDQCGVGSEQFKEVLREACRLAGIDYALA